MNIQDFTVNDGGQAVIGDVTGTFTSEDKPPAKQITDALGETLSFWLEAERIAVPFTPLLMVGTYAGCTKQEVVFRTKVSGWVILPFFGSSIPVIVAVDFMLE